MNPTIHTPIGDFIGKEQESTWQFLGIKYATLADQLSSPELVTSYGGGDVDCTKHGPRAPAMDGCEFEQKTLIQCNIGQPVNPPPMSGTECLNLNITLPLTPSDGDLPVMVFIHGGGFIMGANYWPQYDSSRFVALSGRLNVPAIVVNINYRLGVLGNLTSEELRKAGYPGNNSLRDQKCALQWIRANIGYFGGDEQNVTVFGESAGAAAVLMQLQSTEPLFKRAISMSGTPIMRRPLPVEVAETGFETFMEILGLENATIEDRLEKLRTITPDELVEKTPMTLPLVPFLDGDVIPDTFTFAKLDSEETDITKIAPGWDWCEELMIGDCKDDGNVFLFMGLTERKAGIASAIANSLSTNMSPDSAAAVLEAYNISPSRSDEEVIASLLELGTDIAYHLPARFFAKRFSGKSFEYRFNVPNPWDGVFKGSSTHMLDAAYLLQNFKEFLPANDAKVGEKLAQDFLTFAKGSPPRKSKRVAEKTGLPAMVVYGPKYERRDVLLRLSADGRVDLDELSLAWDLFIAGR